MSWIKKLFNTPGGEAGRFSRFIPLEEEVGLKFPNSFKQIVENGYNRNVIFRLFDSDYHLLSSITDPSATAEFQENFVQTFRDFNHQCRDFSPNKIVPFARRRFGDGYKYLFFLGKEGAICGEEIFMTDFDNPDTGNSRISANIQLLVGEAALNDHTTLIDCTRKTASDLFDFLIMPAEVAEYDDGRKHQKIYRLNAIGTTTNLFQTSLFASIGDFDDIAENFSLIHVYIKIELNGNRYETYHSYELRFKRLKPCIEQNLNHFIFYYKLIAITTELNRMKVNAENSTLPEIVTYINNIDAKTLSDLAMRPFEQIDYLMA